MPAVAGEMHSSNVAARARRGLPDRRLRRRPLDALHDDARDDARAPHPRQDTQWKHHHKDELLESNAQMDQMAKAIAELHGRRPATADEYRSMLGI